MVLPFLPPGSSRFLIATNTASQLVGRIVSSGAIFVASILIARAFGADGYGDFIKITSYIALFYLLADFGMNAVYLQMKNAQAVPAGRQDSGSVWSTLLSLRLAGSIILVFIAIAILSFLPRGSYQGYTDGVRLGIILFSPAIIFQAIITTTNALFQEKLRYDLSMVAVASGSLIALGAVWIVSISSSSLLGPVASSLAFLLGTTLTALLGVFLAKAYVTIRATLDTSLARQLIMGSIPLGLTLLFNQVYFRADSIILTLSRSTVEVGIYGFAYKIFEVALVVPTFFMNSVYPFMLARSSQTNVDDVRNLTKKSLRSLTASSIVVVIVLWIAAPLLRFVRPEFVQSVIALRVLSLSLPFFFLSSLSMWVLITMKKQGILVPIYAVSMIANIGLNLVLIPLWGYMAAAWVTVVSEAFVLLLTGYFVMRTFRFSQTSSL